MPLSSDVQVPESGALARLRGAAVEGDLEACCQLGRCYARGWGGPRDERQAFHWFLRAARGGHDEAAFRAARLLLGKAGPADSAEDVRYALQRAAYGGHIEAQALLGWCHQRGRLVESLDQRAAIEWLQRAAQAGSASGRYFLALNLQQGLGVHRDECAAVVLLELAAEQGDVRAQLALGRALSEGRGVPRDAAAALAWYRIAASRGYGRAQYHLGLLLAGGAAPDQDDEEAACWIHAAAEQGLAKAQYTLASLYERGFGLPQDLHAAQSWLERAARAGHVKSQWRLSRWLKRAGQSAVALRWLEAAAEGGYGPAQFSLARHHLKLGTDSARLPAYLWFCRAAVSGHVQAIYCVGVCHYQGVGTERDSIEAYRWFQHAGMLGSSAALEAMAKLAGRSGPAQLTQVRGPAA